MIPSSSYVPFLKWKQSEYQALLRLDEQVKNSIVPFIIIPPLEYDFEEGRMKKTNHDHMEPMAERLHKKWGARLAIVDFHSSLDIALMDDGYPAILYFFQEALKLNCVVLPTISLNKTPQYLRLIAQFMSDKDKGVALRISFDDLSDQNLNQRITALLLQMNVRIENVDLIIDLNVPDRFEPYSLFSSMLHSLISQIKDLDRYRSFVIAAHSLKWAEVKSPGDLFVRHEWLLYAHLLQKFQRSPTFGDYTIENIDFLEQMDMRVIQPSAKLIYTTQDYWRVLKGKSFRRDPSQMVQLCHSIVTSSEYYGEHFSFGDSRIYETYNKTGSNGTLGTWKQAGINHHMTTVVSQLSNLLAQPSIV